MLSQLVLVKRKFVFNLYSDPNEKPRTTHILPVPAGAVTRTAACSVQLQKYTLQFIFNRLFLLQTPHRHKFQFNSSGLKNKNSQRRLGRRPG